MGAVADLHRAWAAGEDGGADAGRVLRSRVVVGHDGAIRVTRRGFPHQRTLAAIPVAAGAEHHDQAAGGVRAQRGEQPFQRVGGMGVIDIGRRAVGQSGGEFHAPAHAGQRRQAGEHVA